MNKNLLPLSLVASAFALPQLSLAEDTQKPNIIMFLVDDMGWQDTSVPFYGNEKSKLNLRYHTPNMERLAQMGVKFVNAYACAISSPTRCSLMSGMNAARHRVTNWTLQKNTKTDQNSSIIETPAWNYNGIQPATSTLNNATPITSLPDLLKANGYRTIHCGKAHFGAASTDGANPSTMGFDVNIAGAANGAPSSYLASANFKGNNHQFDVQGLEEYWGTDKFLTECLTLEAKKRMDESIGMNKPFYLYMSQYAVHAPYSKDVRFYDNYYNKYDEALGGKINSSEACYDALVEGMDKSLGDILDYVQEKGIADNTIILFMSDNGGQPLSRQGTNYTQNLPARGGKGSAFMGGVREPMMVYMPGITKGGTINTNTVMIEDFYSTILDMAGVKDPKTVQTIDGRSFLDILKDPTIKRDRPVYWHFPNLWGESVDKNYGYGCTSSILDGDYHLIYTWETQLLRLYNVANDIHENIDLAGRMPEKTAELAKKLSDYLRSVDAQRPKLKATGALIGWPDVAGKAADSELPLILSTATIDETATTWPETGMAWHTMKLRENYCEYNATSNAVDVTAESVSANPTDKQLWAFTGNDADGYKIYNKAAGPGKVLWTSLRSKDTEDPILMTDVKSTDGVYWAIGKCSNGQWNLSRKGSYDNFINRRVNKMGTWVNVSAEGEIGSRFTFNLVSNTTEPSGPESAIETVTDTLVVSKGDLLAATNVTAGKLVLLSTISTGGAADYGSDAQVSGNCFNGVTAKTSNFDPTLDNVMMLEDADKTAHTYYLRCTSNNKYVGKNSEANRNLVMTENKTEALTFVVKAATSSPSNQNGYTEGSSVYFITADTKDASNGGARLNSEIPSTASAIRVGTGSFSYWNVYNANLVIPFSSHGSYATLSLPFDAQITKSSIGDVKYYTASILSGNNKLQTTEVGAAGILNLKAGEGILMRGEKTANISLTSDAPSLTNNMLKGSVSKTIENQSGTYKVSQLNTVLGFYPTNFVPAYRAYLEETNGEEAYLFGSTTGISSVAKIATAKTYDISGRLVTPSKGNVVISAGKKVLIK